MLKRGTNFGNVLAAITLISAFTLSASQTPAYALQSDNKRFAICKQLRAAGTITWYGIASGTVEDHHSVFEHDRSFHTKACFTNRADCEKWVKRIWWEIPELDELRTAYCKPARR